MNWDAKVDVVIVGGGGGGLIAALAIAETGLEVAVFEKTNQLLGNTSMSAGMIPACNSKFQKQLSISDSVEIMVNDILNKNHYESEVKQVEALSEISGPLVEWMYDSLGIPLSVVTEFKYPGHTNYRMHATPTRSGLELMRLLKKKCTSFSNIHILYNSELQKLIVQNNDVVGVCIKTSKGLQCISGKKVILATNGFGANKQLVEQFIPEIKDALYFGYKANTGAALHCGLEIGAQTTHLSSYQGHAAINENTGLLVTWGTIMLGGFYINMDGRRFSNETSGYSEFAKFVLDQPYKQGFIIFDEAIHLQLQAIEDYKNLTEMQPFKKALTIEKLANEINVPVENFTKTFSDIAVLKNGMEDEFGRASFKKLEPPYYAIKVSPALFHTQGGLKINENAEVIHQNGSIIKNLYAIGGSAAGISGNGAYGYMSGNGLLAAFGFGKIAALHIIQQLQLKN